MPWANCYRFICSRAAELYQGSLQYLSLQTLRDNTTAVLHVDDKTVEMSFKLFDMKNSVFMFVFF